MGLKREYLHMDNNARGKKTTPGENTTHSTTTKPNEKENDKKKEGRKTYSKVVARNKKR